MSAQWRAASDTRISGYGFNGKLADDWFYRENPQEAWGAVPLVSSAALRFQDLAEFSGPVGIPIYQGPTV